MTEKLGRNQKKPFQVKVSGEQLRRSVETHGGGVAFSFGRRGLTSTSATAGTPPVATPTDSSPSAPSVRPFHSSFVCRIPVVHPFRSSFVSCFCFGRSNEKGQWLSYGNELCLTLCFFGQNRENQFALRRHFARLLFRARKSQLAKKEKKTRTKKKKRVVGRVADGFRCWLALPIGDWLSLGHEKPNDEPTDQWESRVQVHHVPAVDDRVRVRGLGAALAVGGRAAPPRHRRRRRRPRRRRVRPGRRRRRPRPAPRHHPHRKRQPFFFRHFFFRHFPCLRYDVTDFLLLLLLFFCSKKKKENLRLVPIQPNSSLGFRFSFLARSFLCSHRKRRPFC